MGSRAERVGDRREDVGDPDVLLDEAARPSPGSFRKSGTNASSWWFASVGARRLSPPRKLIPWSAVTTTSDRS
jgi:hypothetical protein